jgi:hypothetical protein
LPLFDAAAARHAGGVPNYRRLWIPGGTWFFTVNLLERHENDLFVRAIDLLRRCIAREHVMTQPFLHKSGR